MATECSESKSHYDRPQPCHTVRAVNCDRHSVPYDVQHLRCETAQEQRGDELLL